MPKIDYFSSDSIRQGLKGKTIRGGIALGAAQATAIVTQLASIPILSRLLGPEDFGVITMATLFTGFGHLLIDSGFATATIQRDDVTPRQASNIFWISGAVGTALTSLLLALAWPIGWLYGRDEVPAVVATLAVTFILTSLSIQHTALLQRAMRFSTLAGIRVGSMLASQAVAIGLAYAWGTYWALVAGQLTQAVFGLSAAWICCDWRPLPPSRGVGTRSMVEFGASLTAAKFINYVTRLADQFIVGASIGADALGYYERAHKSLLFPIQSVNGPLVSLMSPALSRVAEQPEAYRRAFFTAVRGLSAIGFPLVALAAIDAERLVPLVLGEQWSPAVPIFVALTPAAMVGVLKSMSSWVYVSLGRGLDQLRWHSIAGVVTLVGVCCGIPWGAVGIAWGFSAARVACFPLSVYLAFEGTTLKTSRLIGSLLPVTLATSVAAGAALLTRSMAPEWFAAMSVGSLSLMILAMGTVYLAVAYVFGLWSPAMLRTLRRAT
ncbi:MAG: lipopolysaccharide biosynthesis protein [Planctomycetota bacterium]